MKVLRARAASIAYASRCSVDGFAAQTPKWIQKLEPDNGPLAFPMWYWEHVSSGFPFLDPLGGRGLLTGKVATTLKQHRQQQFGRLPFLKNGREIERKWIREAITKQPAPNLLHAEKACWWFRLVSQECRNRKVNYMWGYMSYSLNSQYPS